MTSKDYKIVCRMINYDKIHELREKEHKSIHGLPTIWV